MRTWQLQEAKAHLSEVVKEAINHGPQHISLRGVSAVVVLSAKEYDALKKPKLSLVQLLKQSPLKGAALKISRNASHPRDIEL